MRTIRVGAGFAAAAVLLLGACDGGTVAVASGPRAVAEAGVVVTRVPGGVRLDNRTGRGVAWVASNPNWLGLLAICADPGPACVRLAAGESVLVRDADVAGWEPGARQAVVRWWHVEPAGGGWRAGEVHAVTVDL